MKRCGLSKSFWDFEKFLKKVIKKKKASPLIFLMIFFFLLPGQNYYQRLEPIWEEPLVREVSLELSPLSLYPKNLNKIPAPDLTSRAAIVIDVPSGKILYEKNPRTWFLPASTTKIVTALVALENYSLEQVMEVGDFDSELGQVMGLFEGEKITMENLLFGLLVQSGNDAAEVLAKEFPGGREAFIKKMNEKVKSLNLADTHFVNPTGFEEDGHHTTVFDLSQIATEALKNPYFAKMVATKEIDASDTEGVNWHHLENVNRLLGELWGIKGVKTGWTEKAGECLVAYFERDSRQVITVILGSEDRFGETEKLINWVFANFSWEAVTPPPTHY